MCYLKGWYDATGGSKSRGLVLQWVATQGSKADALRSISTKMNLGYISSISLGYWSGSRSGNVDPEVSFVVSFLFFFSQQEIDLSDSGMWNCLNSSRLELPCLVQNLSRLLITEWSWVPCMIGKLVYVLGKVGWKWRRKAWDEKQLTNANDAVTQMQSISR